MEIQNINGIKLNLDEKNHTASVIGLVSAEKIINTILIPQYVIFKNEKYFITSIKSKTFEWKTIKYLKFDEDSEIDDFHDIFDQTKITKLQIPPKLKTLDRFFALYVKDLVEIEISPKNKNFIYYDHKLLLGKSNSSSDIFDILYYSRFDIEEVIIPPQIKVLGSFCFDSRKKLKSVIFSEDSELKEIQSFSFYDSTIEHLVLPANDINFDDSSFTGALEIKEIEIHKNDDFFFVDKKILVDQKTKRILFSYRDVEEVTIPSYIKKIAHGAFDRCTKLKSVSFEPKSSLKVIDNSAFHLCFLLESIVVPRSVVEVNAQAFNFCDRLTSIKFLSKRIYLLSGCLEFCGCLQTVYFPNARKIVFEHGLSNTIDEQAKIFVRRDAEIINYTDDDKEKLVYYEVNEIDEEESDSINEEEEIDIISDVKERDSINDEIERKILNDDDERDIINDDDERDIINDDDERETINDDDERETINDDDEDIGKEENEMINEDGNSQEEADDDQEEIMQNYISAENTEKLMNYIHSKCNPDQISTIFNKCYKNHKFFESLCQEGIKINDAVSHHKYAISLIFNSDAKERSTNLAEARKHLEKSIQLGYNLSYFSLARLLHEYFNEDDLAFVTAKEGMMKGEKYSKCLLGHFISKGIGTQKDQQKGVKMMLDSDAEDYYKRFPTDIAIYYFNLGEKVKKYDSKFEYENLNEFKISFKWFERAFLMKQSQATLNNYGICFMRGIGVSANFEKAKEIFEIGVQKNDPISMYHLAFILSKTNPRESLYYYRRSAKQGYRHAQRLIPFLDENEM
ncbi:hypothetical protein M9Y10_008805 [Tritrichomonas musculus]|uniref:Uncharacterized protein n=1 Tax=Tritrichomonas musculus TaxID=1915356 RepID=A0ABR2J086_9EUKA